MLYHLTEAIIMKIQITGRHVEITEAIKAYVEEKVGKIEHHFDNIIGTKVILSVEKDRQIAEAIVNVPGTEIVAQADSTDMYAAIDMMEEKLDRQVRKHKDKMRSRQAVRPDHSEVE